MAIQPRRTRGQLQRRARVTLQLAARRAVTSLLARYLAAVTILLAAVLAIAPTPRDLPTPAVWDYQRERVALDGGGLLNSYARASVQVTTFTARTAIERQRDLHRFSLLETTAGQPAARAIATFRTHWQLALEAATTLALVGLVVWRALATPKRRLWLAGILLLLTTTVLVTHPHTTLRAAAVPGAAIQTLSVKLLTLTDPTGAPVAPSVTDAQHQIAADYWRAFVGDPLSRLQTGTGVLAAAPAGAKPGVLAFLAEHLTAVNDWALGRHGLERAVIATFALVYALPFALVVWALSMLATVAQALLWLLLVVALAVVPLAVEPRWRPAIRRLWLLPLGGSAAVLATATLASLGTLRLAALVRLGDQYVGMLLAGAVLPAAVLFLIGRRLLARWRTHQHRRRTTPTSKPPTRTPTTRQHPDPAHASTGTTGTQAPGAGQPKPLGGVA